MSLQFEASEPCSSQSTNKSSKSKQSNPMYWTVEHDTLLCREILAVDPFETKKGTAMRGERWKAVADNLMAITTSNFKVEARSVRDRYRLLSQRLKRKLSDEKKASGIETDMAEWEIALEELIEKENESDAVHEADTDTKNKVKEKEKKTAEGMRKAAMETMGKRKKSAGHYDDCEVKPKIRRSNGIDTLMYLKERNESLEKFRMQELEMKKKELALQEKKHDDTMKVMAMQQQQQAKQMQDFQTMMLTLITRMSQK